MVPDRKTEGEIGSGSPPSYLVMVRDSETGKVDVAEGKVGKPLRYRWDISGPLADRRKQFELDRKAVLYRRQRPGTRTVGGILLGMD